MDQLPPSPPAEPSPSINSGPVPLDSPIRTTPIHELLPDIRIPSSPLPPHRYDPITCAPIDADDERVCSELVRLRKDFPTPEAALKAQEQAVRELKQKLDDAEKKREEVQRAMDKKIKERNTELKVLEKFQDGKGPALAAA
ncbi:hypothetical protein BDW66DRAFT_139866 [Aspergillus desertorum]